MDFKDRLRRLTNNLRSGLYKFMYGRNGVDLFSQFLLRFSFVFLLPSLILKGIAKNVFYSIFLVIIIYTYFRILSKNIYKRQRENTWFVSKSNYLKQRITQRKQYRFYDCPKCHTHLRVPKGAGSITITCKKCGYQFDKKA